VLELHQEHSYDDVSAPGVGDVQCVRFGPAAAVLECCVCCSFLLQLRMRRRVGCVRSVDCGQGGWICSLSACLCFVLTRW